MGGGEFNGSGKLGFKDINVWGLLKFWGRYEFFVVCEIRGFRLFNLNIKEWWGGIKIVDFWIKYYFFFLEIYMYIFKFEVVIFVVVFCLD